MKPKYHQPVLVDALIKILHIKKARYIDATVGQGGHALEILKLGGQVLGIDRDQEILKVAQERLVGKGCFKLVQGNFRQIDRITQDFAPVEGIIFDLGISSFHYDSQRGFSFKDKEALLDMRLDPRSQGVKAADIVNGLREDQLRKMFSRLIGKRKAGLLTAALIKQREQEPIKTVGDFLKVTNVLGEKKINKLHPATKVFLALRMAVNSELEDLIEALPKALSLLVPNGRLAVISFHSFEDRIVKIFFKKSQERGQGLILTKKPIRPTEKEIADNPRSRSAKLRVLKKL